MNDGYTKEKIEERIGDVVTGWGHERLVMFVGDVLRKHYLHDATEDHIGTLMEDGGRYDEVHVQLLKHFSNKGYPVYPFPKTPEEGR